MMRATLEPLLQTPVSMIQFAASLNLTNNAADMCSARPSRSWNIAASGVVDIYD